MCEAHHDSPFEETSRSGSEMGNSTVIAWITVENLLTEKNVKVNPVMCVRMCPCDTERASELLGTSESGPITLVTGSRGVCARCSCRNNPDARSPLS